MAIDTKGEQPVKRSLTNRVGRVEASLSRTKPASVGVKPASPAGSTIEINAFDDPHANVAGAIAAILERGEDLPDDGIVYYYGEGTNSTGVVIGMTCRRIDGRLMVHSAEHGGLVDVSVLQT